MFTCSTRGEEPSFRSRWPPSPRRQSRRPPPRRRPTSSASTGRYSPASPSTTSMRWPAPSTGSPRQHVRCQGDRELHPDRPVPSATGPAAAAGGAGNCLRACARRDSGSRRPRPRPRPPRRRSPGHLPTRLPAVRSRRPPRPSAAPASAAPEPPTPRRRPLPPPRQRPRQPLPRQQRRQPPDATATPTTPDVAIGVPVTPGGPEAGSSIAPVSSPAPATPDATATPAPAATPTPADAGAAIAPAPRPAPPPTPADAGAAIAPHPRLHLRRPRTLAPRSLPPAPHDRSAAPPRPPAPATQDGLGPPTPPANPDAPPEAPNPTPTTGTGGVSVGASYYDGVGGGATLVVTPTGTYIVPEFGIGFGPSVSANAGSNVNVPNAPQLQLGFTGGDQIGTSAIADRVP